jgi:TolB-like protein
MKHKLLQKGLGIFGILLTLLMFGASSAQAQDLSKLATELATRIRAMKHDRVTVLDFVDLDKKTNKLGKLLTQKLQLALAEPSHELAVVDQSQLPQLFDQMEKLNEGLLDPATGKQLGKITGVEVVIVGTVMVSSMSVKLDVKAIDLQTAKLITGESSSISRMGFNMVDKLAQEVEGGETEMGMAWAADPALRRNQQRSRKLYPAAVMIKEFSSSLLGAR